MEYNRMNSCGCRQQTASRRTTDSSMNFRQQEVYSMSKAMKESNSLRIGEKIDGLPLGMAYVPEQHYTEMFELGRGLREGTIFPELCLPFCGKRRVRSC